MPGPIPFHAITAVFLDVGNTLISFDFELVAAELAARGVHVEPAALRRAEAAARPPLSAAARELGTTEAVDVLLLYLRATLANLPAAAGCGHRLDELAASLGAALKQLPTHRLWSNLLPGVPAALASLRELGLRLVAVSNSDGTCEISLRNAGILPLLDAVLDSHLVGVEKPHPAIFHRALEAAGAPDPANTLHVGDLYDFDVVGARAAGLHAALVDPFGDWNGVDCERVRDVAELAERLRHSRQG